MRGSVALGEETVSRVIRTESVSRSRERLLDGASLALEGIEQSDDQPDRLAFLALCLDEARRSVEQTIEAWEKRGYWLKADRFRADWRWLETAAAELAEALTAQDIEAGLRRAKALDGHLPQLRSGRKRGQTALWKGAWQLWTSR